MTPPAVGLPLLTADDARAGDRAAVEAGDTWAGLMERAAGHLARGVARLAGRTAGLRVVLVVGKGNNGGDGWAAAHRLHAMGAACTVASVVALDAEMSDEAAGFRARWLARGGRAVVGVDAITGALRDADVAVDCLLGTGATGGPRGDLGAACEALLAARTGGVRVVACDVPSGVDADTGAAPWPAVEADLTVTFGMMKRGLALHPGAAHAGRVVVGSLGPRFAPPDGPWLDTVAMTAGGAAPPRLAVDADKRSRGTVLLVAGSVGTAGAAILATEGALRAGAGLATLATPAHVQRVIAPVVPSAMTRPLRHSNDHVGVDAVAQLEDAGHYDAVVAGPGLGPVAGTRAVVDHLRATARRLVLDADALNVFRDDHDALGDHAGALVLTPHERELARIGGGTDGADAWAERIDRVPALAARYEATIVVKGPGTLVAAPGGRLWVIPVGGPELGTGGSGDVLAGMLAAAIATAHDVPLAVARACFWHGFTGAWLAAGRPPADRIGDLRGATMAGFGPSSQLARALPDALRVLTDLAARRPRWPYDPHPEP